MSSLPLALALSLALSVPFFPSAAAIPSAAEQTVQAPEPGRKPPNASPLQRKAHR